MFKVGKIGKSSEDYGNEGFNFDMNINCSSQNKSLFYSCYWWRQKGLMDMFKCEEFLLTKKDG